MNNKSIKLNGHSGFEVRLYESRPGYFLVRKQAIEESHNKRLRLQYSKHDFFYGLKQDFFYVPKIVKSGIEKKLFFYEYEFVEGVTLLHYIEREPLDKVIRTIDNLAAVIKYFKLGADYYEKINSDTSIKAALEKKLSAGILHYPSPQHLQKTISLHLSAFPDTKIKSICHGDLTFDNIIVDRQNRLWLIDFLELFYPHYWFDIAKLFQDIDGKWHEFKYGLRLPGNKLVFIREHFLNKISEFDPFYGRHHNFLLVAALLRILPYLKSEQEKLFILEKINYFSSL